MEDDIKMDAKYTDALDSSLKEFDAKRLAELVKTEVGDRTQSMFCEERNVSRTTLHTILNDKLEAPPSASTLVKIAGPNEALRNELLGACGYSLSDWIRARKNSERRKTLKQLILPEAENYAVRGLMLVLSILKRAGKDSEYRWRYPDENMFMLAADRYDVIGIPAFCINELECDSVHQKISKLLLKMLFSLTLSNDEEHRQKFFLVITNSDQAYGKLQTTGALFAELPFRIAVALCADGMTVDKQEEVNSDGAGDGRQNQEPFPLRLNEL